MELCEKRKLLINADGHLLIMGGPGAGKTTIALLKANHIIAEKKIASSQKVLFLSFARSTITQIQKTTKSLITTPTQKNIEINTYHGFIWRLLLNYAYLIIPHRSIQLLTPPMAGAYLAELDGAESRSEILEKLFIEKGLLSFDLFARTAADLFNRSDRILKLVTDAYPVIVVDEFQDTDGHEWNFIKHLGKYSTIIALADPEQRIYDFRGASVKRIAEYSETFAATVFDFEKENNRSTGKDITAFGNDLLSSKNKGKTYNDVIINKYPFNRAEPNKILKLSIILAIKRLKPRLGNEWSIAILVRSKKMMLSVSSYLSSRTSLPTIFHEVSIDPNGPSLAGVIIAGLMEPPQLNQLETTTFDIINHIRGRTGEKVPDTAIQFTNAISSYLKTGKVTGKIRLQFISELTNIIDKRTHLILSGVPEADWLAIRKLFQDCESTYLKNVFEDAKYLRLLNRGALLSERLSEKWRLSQTYQGAKGSIEDALLQEHFMASQNSFKGVHIMTLHKSKGKEFDEVYIWEDYFNPVVHPNSTEKELNESRYLLRVGVTRARERATFLTVASQPCILL
ncbi:MAG TPA: ATP-dependent helicase [Sphingobacteriaceae bacterium]